MVGYYNASERYLARWTDVYGGRFSVTLGYGTGDGNDIRFGFEYRDGLPCKVSVGACLGPLGVAEAR